MNSLRYDQPHARILAHLVHSLPAAGMRVTQSFNSRDIVTTQAKCALHSAENCDRALTVLLVYGSDPQPATLMVQGHNEQSWVLIDQSYGQQVSAEFQASILEVANQAAALGTSA